MATKEMLVTALLIEVGQSSQAAIDAFKRFAG